MPGQFEKIHQTKISKLSDDERKALEKSPKERSAEENNLAATAEYKTKATWDEVADQAPDELRPRVHWRPNLQPCNKRPARSTPSAISSITTTGWPASIPSRHRSAWMPATRCTRPASSMMTAIWHSRAANTTNRSPLWRKVLDNCHVLRDSQIMADELNDEIDKYKKLLGQIGVKFPEPFVLQDMLDLHEGKRPSGEELDRRKLQENASPDTPKETEPKPRSVTG